MRLLKLFSRRKKKKELDEASVLPVKDTMEEDGNLLQTTSGEKKESEMDMESESAYLDSKKDREDYIRNQCERMVEAAKQIDDAKVEYEAVTSYLNDMQKIDLIEPEKRKIVDDAARNIVM